MLFIFSAICTLSVILFPIGQSQNQPIEIRPEDCEWKFAMFAVFSESGCSGGHIGMRDSILNGAVLAKLTLDKTPYCNSSIVNFTSNMVLTAAVVPDSNPGPVDVRTQIMPQYARGGTGSMIIPKVVVTDGFQINEAAIPQGCQICHIFGNYNLTWDDVVADLNSSIDNPGSGREVYDTVLISAAGRVGLSTTQGVQCDMGEIVDAFEGRTSSESALLASAIVTLDQNFLNLTGPELFLKISASYNSDVSGFHDVWDLAAEAMEEERNRELSKYFSFHKNAQRENCDLTADVEDMSTRDREFCRNNLAGEGCGRQSCERRCYNYDEGSDGTGGARGSGESGGTSSNGADSDGTNSDGARESDAGASEGTRGSNSDGTTDSDGRQRPDPSGEDDDDDGIVTCLALGCTDPVPDPIKVPKPCKIRNATCTCQGLTKINNFDDENFEDRTKCERTQIEMPNCATGIRAAINEYAVSNTNEPFSMVVKKFLNDSRIDIDPAMLPNMSMKCLDCAESNQCRNCMQRKKILAHMVYCNETEPMVAMLRKNAVWNLCASEKGAINCPKGDFNCNDASVEECEHHDFCQYLPEVHKHCTDEDENIFEWDFDCLPFTCEGFCDSKYTFKGEVYELNETVAQANAECPLEGFKIMHNTEKPGYPMNGTLASLMCEHFFWERRFQKAYFQFVVDGITMNQCGSDMYRMSGFSTMKDSRIPFDNSKKRLRMKRQAGFRDGDDDDDDDDDDDSYHIIEPYNMTCMNDSGMDYKVLAEGGVCITLLAEGADIDADNLTLGVDYWFTSYESYGLTCEDACKYEKKEQTKAGQNPTILCCDKIRMDGRPCNEPMGDTFKRMVQTQECGKRCEDRKKDFFTEMCTRCSEDYDCPYNMRCTLSDYCMPPVMGTEGEEQLMFMYSDMVKMQYCPAALRATQICPLITAAVNPRKSKSCEAESKSSYRDPYDMVRGVTESCASDSNAVGFADMNGQCSCTMTSKNGKCYEPDLSDEGLYEQYYPCSDIVQKYILKTLEFSGDPDNATCEDDPLTVMLHGRYEDNCTEIHNTSQLLHILPCDQACKALADDNGDLRMRLQENAEDADRLNTLLRRCDLKKIEQDAAESGAEADPVDQSNKLRCLQSLNAVKDMAAYNGRGAERSYQCDRANQYASLCVAQPANLNGMDPASDAEIKMAFSNCIQFMGSSEALTALYEKLEGMTAANDIKPYCGDIQSVIDKLEEDPCACVSRPALNSLVFDMFKMHCSNYINENVYCKVADIMEELPNSNLGRMYLFNSTFYEEDIMSGLCINETGTVCGVKTENITQKICSGQLDQVHKSKMECIVSALNRNCDNGGKVKDNLESVSCAKLESLPVVIEESAFLQGKKCNCTACDTDQLLTSFGFSEKNACKRTCPSRITIDGSAAAAVENSEMMENLDESGSIKSLVAACGDIDATGQTSFNSFIMLACLGLKVLQDLPPTQANIENAALSAGIGLPEESDSSKNGKDRAVKEIFGKYFNALPQQQKEEAVRDYYRNETMRQFCPPSDVRELNASHFECAFNTDTCSFTCDIEAPKDLTCGRTGKKFCDGLKQLVAEEVGTDCTYADIVRSYPTSGAAAYCFINKQSITEVNSAVDCETFLDESEVCELASTCPKIARAMSAMSDCAPENSELTQKCSAILTSKTVSDNTLDQMTCETLKGVAKMLYEARRETCIYDDVLYEIMFAVVEVIFNNCTVTPADVTSLPSDVFLEICCVMPKELFEAIGTDTDLLNSLAPMCSQCKFGQLQKDAIKTALLENFADQTSRELCAAGALTLQTGITQEELEQWGPLLPSLFDQALLDNCPEEVAPWIMAAAEESIFTEEQQNCRDDLDTDGCANRIAAANRSIDTTLKENGIAFEGSGASTLTKEVLCAMGCRTILTSGSQVLANHIMNMDSAEFQDAINDRCLFCFPPKCALDYQGLKDMRSAMCSKIMQDLSGNPSGILDALTGMPAAFDGCEEADLDGTVFTLADFEITDSNFMKYISSASVRTKCMNKIIESSQTSSKRSRQRRNTDDCSGMNSNSVVTLGDSICSLSEACVNSLPTDTLYNMATDTENPLYSSVCSSMDVYGYFLNRYVEDALFGPLTNWTDDEIVSIGRAVLALTGSQLYSMDASNIPEIPPAIFADILFTVLEALKAEVDANGGDHLTSITADQLRQRTEAEVTALGLVYPVITSSSFPSNDVTDPGSTVSAAEALKLPEVVMGSILALVARRLFQ